MDGGVQRSEPRPPAWALEPHGGQARRPSQKQKEAGWPHTAVSHSEGTASYFQRSRREKCLTWNIPTQGATWQEKCPREPREGGQPTPEGQMGAGGVQPSSEHLLVTSQQVLLTEVQQRKRKPFDYEFYTHKALFSLEPRSYGVLSQRLMGRVSLAAPGLPT